MEAEFEQQQEELAQERWRLNEKDLEIPSFPILKNDLMKVLELTIN